MELALGILLIIVSLFLIVSVLMQSSKSHRLSGTIAGGAETFFGKTKGGSLDKKLSKLTAIAAVVFAVLVIVMYLVQGANTPDYSNPQGSVTDAVSDNVDSSDETGDASEPENVDTEADTSAASGDAE